MKICQKVTLEHLVLQMESGSRPRGGARSTEGVYSIGAEHINKEGGFSGSLGQKYTLRDMRNSLLPGLDIVIRYFYSINNQLSLRRIVLMVNK